MKKRYIALGTASLLVLGMGAAAYVVSPTIHAGRTGEAPALGQTGDFALGTFEREFTLPDRTQIGGWSAVSGALEPAARTLRVRMWYPAATRGSNPPVNYTHIMQRPGRDPFEITSQGIAFADAPPLADGQYPLVLMSHGFGGWNTQFSTLAEHIASRGYVVASIDHADQTVEGIPSFLLSFLNVLKDRTQDQRQILSMLIAQAETATDPHLALIDTENIALIGYSMGGYGAFATAGAPYQFAHDPLSSLPQAAQEKLAAATLQRAPVKALVTFAPWGGQPDNRAWKSADLEKVDIPVLLVAGDQDDVVNYDAGITWLFDNLRGTDRTLLTFREARHNIVGNDFEVGKETDFQAVEFLKEPVWRSDRLNAINQHFVTAFLDLHLKGDAAKADFLSVPTIDSNASKWDVSFGEQLNGKLAGPDENQHWRGFQRRWAVGLNLHTAAKGESGNLGASQD